MSCEVDIKEYFLGETPAARRPLVEGHVKACDSCREELASLQLTHAALGALRDEEIPRRIAFVSDKVFEPRWYQRLWHSGPQLGFLAASLLAGAILVHAYTSRSAPLPAPAPVVQAATIDPAVIEAAVNKAVAASEVRQQKKTLELVRAAESRYEMDRRATLAAIADQNLLLRKVDLERYAINAGMRGGQ